MDVIQFIRAEQKCALISDRLRLRVLEEEIVQKIGEIGRIVISCVRKFGAAALVPARRIAYLIRVGRANRNIFKTYDTLLPKY